MRLFEEKDYEDYLNMSEDFYSCGAALETIPESHFEKTFSRCLKNEPYLKGYIIEQENESAGYCLVTLFWSCECGGMVALLDEIYIKPEFRGQSLATEFIPQMEQELVETLGITAIRLEVCESNHGAIYLYEKLGFTNLPYLQMRKVY